MEPACDPSQTGCGRRGTRRVGFDRFDIAASWVWGMEEGWVQAWPVEGFADMVHSGVAIAGERDGSGSLAVGRGDLLPCHRDDSGGEWGLVSKLALISM